MILSRIIANLKAQHWTAIAIEFVIVVIGVFVGMQVSNWNEARREHALEHEYLVRILADIDATLVSIEPNGTAATWDERRLATQSLVIGALRSGALAEADREAFDEGLMFFGYVGGARIRWSAAEELKSTGSMALIRDTALRDLIGQTDAYLQRKAGISETFTGAINGYRLKIGDRFAVEKLSDWKGENGGVVLRYDFAALASDRSFINALTQIDALSRMKLMNSDEAVAQVRLLREAIAAHLGVEAPADAVGGTP